MAQRHLTQNGAPPSYFDCRLTIYFPGYPQGLAEWALRPPLCVIRYWLSFLPHQALWYGTPWHRRNAAFSYTQDLTPPSNKLKGYPTLLCISAFLLSCIPSAFPASLLLCISQAFMTSPGIETPRILHCRARHLEAEELNVKTWLEFFWHWKCFSQFSRLTCAYQMIMPWEGFAISSKTLKALRTNMWQDG
jgi:hypothetical protein